MARVPGGHAPFNGGSLVCGDVERLGNGLSLALWQQDQHQDEP
jgi:hypothetical protein